MFTLQKGYLLLLSQLLFLLVSTKTQSFRYQSMRIASLRSNALVFIDSDGDGVDDAQDLDDDNDGILDQDEAPLTVLRFYYINRDQVFTVPSQVDEIHIKIWGAGGGGSNFQSQYSPGGAGGFVSGTLPVNSGDQFSIMVGQGGISDNSTTTGPIYGFGGSPTARFFGSYGGGLSGIFSGAAPILPTSQSRAVLIAGGGGAGERSTVFTAIGGQGGDPVLSGGNPTMQGSNDTFDYGGGGGGGYFGGIAEQTRITTDPTRVQHGEGGSNYINPLINSPQSLSNPDLATLINPYAIQENQPPNTSDPDYRNGIGTGTSNSGFRGGHGLVVISYVQKMDTDGDGTPDYLDLDSDNDGCSDANEAYANPEADGGDGAVYGTGTPTLTNGGVNGNGLVVAAGLNTTGDAYTNTVTTVSGKQTFREGIIVSIDQNPTDQVVDVGDPVQFTASASTSIVNTTPTTSLSQDLAYIWQVSTDNGLTYDILNNQFGNTSSGSSVSLDLGPADAGMHGNLYRLLFLNPANVCTSVTTAARLSIRNAMASVSLQKSGVFNDENSDGLPQAEETITYNFIVENTGTTLLETVEVTDDLLGGQICSFTNLLPGESVTCSADYSLTQTELNAGKIENQATVTAHTGTAIVTDLSDDPNDATDFDANNDGEPDDITVLSLPANPQIRLVKRAAVQDQNADGCTDEGETITYSLSLINTGNVSLNQVLVSDDLLGGLLNSFTGDLNSNQLLDPEEEWLYTETYSIELTDIELGFVENQAFAEATAPGGIVVSDRSGATPADDVILRTELCQINSISLQKSAVFNDENRDGFVQQGETISYTFNLTNTGNITIADIVITDALLDGGACALQSLRPGEVSVPCSLLYTITAEDLLRGAVTNQALATGYSLSGIEVSDLSDDPQDSTDLDLEADGEPDDPTITQLPQKSGDLEVFNGITPNDDGRNDFFKISGIENYPDNAVKIFNRWGVLVWETQGYDESSNVFRGFSNGRATLDRDTKLPPGTYFYSITIPPTTDQNGQSLTGYLYLNY